MLNLFSGSSVRKARRSSRSLTPTVAGLEGRALLSTAPVTLVGGVLLIEAAPGGDKVASAATVSFSDANTIEVDYSAQGGLGGDFTSYFFDASQIDSVVFIGNGRDLLENDTNTIDSLAFATGDNNVFIGSLEDDTIVFVGDDNQATGGGGSDVALLIGQGNTFIA